MAWTERLASGRYRGCWRDNAGTKHYTQTYRLKADAKADADERQVQARRQAARHDGRLSARITWAQWWDLVVATRTPSNNHGDDIRAGHARRYLIPKWGDTPLNKITQKDVRLWVAELAAGQAVGWDRKTPPQPNTVQSIYSTFSATINQAVAEEVLTASPCAKVKLPVARRKRLPHATVEDLATIQPRLRQDYRDAVETLLETGLRPGELCGLHADRVDFDRGVIEVCQVRVSRRVLIRPWPKDHDERIVPMTTRVAAILRKRLEKRDLKAGCGVPHTDGKVCRSVLVFLTDRGKPMTPKGLGDYLAGKAKSKKTRDLPTRSPYSYRRGFATRAARGGMDAFAIADVMGHSDVKITRQYVQEEELGVQLRAAFGERPALRAIEGQRGADRGADPSQTVANDGTDGNSGQTG